MSKFFKSLLLLLTAGLFTATGWAELVATWTNFKNLETQNGVSLSLNGNTVANDGSSVTIGGEAATDGLTIDYAGAMTVVMEVSDIPVGQIDGKAIVLWSAIVSNHTHFLQWNGSKFQQKYDSADGIYGDSVWSANSARHILVFRTGGSDGTFSYLDGVCIASGGTLKWSGATVNGITVGAYSGNTSVTAATGMKVHRIELYNSFLDATTIKSNYDTYFNGLTEYAAEIATSKNASELEWPDDVTLAQVSANKAKFTVSNSPTLTIDSNLSSVGLTIDGTGALTIATDGTNKLSAASTTINADTTVEAGAASLGAVTIADDKTLTVKDNATVDAIVTDSKGTLVVDATAGDIAFTTQTALTLDEIRQYTGKIKILGSDVNGGTLAYTTGELEFKSHLIFDNGTHTFKYGRGQVTTFATGAKNDNPTIWVTNEATLDFYGKDLSGWASGDASDTGIIRVDNGSTLNFFKNGGTFYYRQRLYLEPGATMTIADAFGTDFRLHGGVATAETAQLYVPGVEADAEVKVATISGGAITFARDATKGLGVNVGANATLKIENAIAWVSDTSGSGKDSPIAKYGDGTLKLTGQNTAAGTLTVSNGTLDLASKWAGDVDVSGSIVGAGAITGKLILQNGAILDVSQGALTVTGEVWVMNGDNNTATVQLPTNCAVGTPIVSCSNASTVAGHLSNKMPAGYKCVAVGNVVELAIKYEAKVPAGAALTFNDVFEGETFVSGIPLTINFGDKGDGETQPGTFTFNNEDVASFAQIIVKGTNGGTITKAEGAGAVSASATTIAEGCSVTVPASTATLGAVAIEENATLSVVDETTVASVTGAGTLVCTGILPKQTTGFTTGTPAEGENLARGWTGTVWIKNLTWTTKTPFPINEYGNSSSTLCLDGVTGRESYISPGTDGSSYTPNIRLENNGWKSQNGNSGAKLTFTGALSGSGLLDMTHGTPSEGQLYCFMGGATQFKGVINVAANQIVSFGDPNLTYANKDWSDSQSVRAEGKIFIAAPVTIFENKEWTATNGITVTATGTLSGSGTIGSALTLNADATIDVSNTETGILTANMLNELPANLTVKVAAAPTEDAPVTILKTSATPDVTKPTVTLVTAEGPVDGQYDLIKNGNLLQVIPHVERIAAGTTCQVNPIPKKIYLDTATFSGYGQTFTVLQYTGEDTPDWTGMSVVGLPEGVTKDDFVIDNENKTWGFVIKKLSDELIWLPVGDSITEGEQWMGHADKGDVNTRGGYRYQVWKQLEERSQTARTVGFRTGHSSTEEDPTTTPWAWHAGLYGGDITPGNSSAQLFNVETTLEVAGYPDVISILIGINDLSRPGGGDTDEARAKVYGAWAALVDRYAKLRPNTKVLAATLLPVVGTNATSNDFGPFNAMVRAAALAGESPFDNENVVLVDVCAEAFNNTFNATYFKTIDGLHPNETGAIMVAEVFRNAIYTHVIKPMSAATPAIVHVDNATNGLITVLFNKKIATTTATELTVTGTNLAGDEVAITCTTPTIEGRVMTFALPTETNLVAGTYTVTVNGTVTSADGVTSTETVTANGAAVEIFGTGAVANVPASFREGFIHRNTLNVEENPFYNGEAPVMDVIDDREVSAIEKVGYYVELQRAGQAPQFVWVSMDASAFNNNEARASIPTTVVGTITSKVSDLAVYGNRGNFAKSITDGQGVIEFSPYNFEPNETTRDGWPAEMQSGRYGWNDTFRSNLFGSMQVARIRTERDSTKSNKYDPEAEMLFAFNGFNYNAADNTDIGIGSFSVHRHNAGDVPGGGGINCKYDWTNFYADTQYAKFATSAYTVRKIELWVAPALVKEAIINVGTGDNQYTIWSAAKDALGLEGTMTSVTINFTAAAQTFEFDETVTIDAVTVQGEVGTIAKASNADVEMASLSLQTNVTAPVAFYNGCTGSVTAASATTVVAMNDATAATLTATIQDGILTQVGEGTVTFAPETWSSSVTPKKFEVVKGTLTFGKSCTGWTNPPQLIVSGGTLNLNDTHTYNATDGSGYLKDVSSEPLVIMGGATASTIEGGAITPWIANANAGEKTMIKYVGNGGQNAPATFAANIDGVYSPENHIRIIDVEKGAQTSGYDLAITGAIGVTEDRYMKVENGTMKGSTLKKTGAGTLLLSGTNNFPKLEIAEGVLKLGSATALSAKVQTITIAAGATLDLNGHAITLTGVTISGAGQVIDSALTKGSLTLAGTSTVNGLNAEGVALVIAEGAKITTAVASLRGDITLQEGAVLIDTTTDDTDATDLGTRTITVIPSETAGDRAVIARQNPFNGNSDTFVTSDVTLTGEGNFALAGMCGGGTAVFQALNFAAGTDFSGEISVFNQYAKDTKVTIANSHLAKATYMFIDSVASNVGSNVEGSHTLTIESEDEVTLAAIGQAFVTTPMRPMSLVINAPLTVTNGITVTGAGTISGEGSIVLGVGSTLCYESSEASTFNGCITGALSVTKGPLTLATVDDSDAKKNELTNLTISGTMASKAALKLERPTTISGDAEVKTSGASAEYAAQLILSNEVTLKNGARLTLREYAVVDAAALSVTSPMLVIAGGATICCDSAKSYQVTCPIKFEAGAIVDTATYSKDNATEKLNAYLRYTGGARNLTFPEDGKVIFKIKHNGTFLAVPVFLDAQTEGLNKQWSTYVELQNSDGTSWSTENHYIVTREKFREFHVGVQKAKIKNASPELEAYAAKLAYELSIWSTIPTDVTSVDNLEYDSCFLNYGASGLVNGKLSLYADFGINDVKVLRRTIESVTKDQVAIEVKVGNGAGKPADLRDTSVIYFSTDGKASDDPEKVWLVATRLTSEDLKDVGLTNGEGVYWFWAGDLPTIEPGTTSTTHHYKVKAVNTTYDSQPTPSSQQ